MNYNKVIVAGNLTRDPEIKHTPNGVMVCSFSIAVNRQGKDKKEVSFFNVVAWQKTGELVARYLTKGSGVLIEGRLQSRNYQDKQGQNRTAIEIVAEQVVFVGKGQGKAEPQAANTQGEAEEVPF